MQAQKVDENIQPNQNKADKVVEFLDKLIQSFIMHKRLHTQSELDEELSKLYTELSSGNYEHLILDNAQAGREIFQQKLLVDYFKELASLKQSPTIAIKPSNNTIMIWAEVENEEEEFNLYRIEGRINVNYGSNGFRVDTTIVDKDDHIPIPSNYHLITQNPDGGIPTTH